VEEESESEEWVSPPKEEEYVDPKDEVKPSD